MTDQPSSEPSNPQLPEAVVQTRSRFSLVWLIPLVAAAIGAWLAYKAFSEQGPTITIAFKTAEGLEAGKTKLKYKDVEVGLVEAINLGEDLSDVVVTAQMVKGAEPYLTENTRFWVERARIAGGQVSGLSTLLAGAYIGIDPVPEGERTTHFIGLKIPPIVTAGEPGRHYRLHAEELGSLEVGAPVYFREIKVGEVVAYELDASGQGVDMQIFVHAPHHERVRENTRFWNASGIDVSLNASGLEIDTKSLISILIGGVAFETPETLEAGNLAAENTVFRLHPNRKRAFEKTYAEKSRWLLNFTGSAKGLVTGAPVEFKGIKLGEVLDIKVEFDLAKVEARIPVLIEMEPERLVLINNIAETGDETEFEQARRAVMDRLVAKGFRGQLKSGNLLTGAMLVDLVIDPNAKPQQIVWEGRYPELPTIPTPLEEIENALVDTLEKIKQLPLEQIGKDLQQSLAALSQAAQELGPLLAQLNTKVAPNLNATLVDVRQTLGTAQKALGSADQALLSADKAMISADEAISPDSPLQQELQSVLRELGAAARSIRVMADYLERHPEALIQGKRGRGR